MMIFDVSFTAEEMKQARLAPKDEFTVSVIYFDREGRMETRRTMAEMLEAAECVEAITGARERVRHDQALLGRTEKRLAELGFRVEGDTVLVNVVLTTPPSTHAEHVAVAGPLIPPGEAEQLAKELEESRVRSLPVKPLVEQPECVICGSTEGAGMADIGLPGQAPMQRQIRCVAHTPAKKPEPPRAG